MIYTFISDIKKLNSAGRVENIDTARLIYEGAPTSVRAYINATANKALRLSRIGAYNTLFSALRLFFGKVDFEIERDECGKPRLMNTDGSFSGIYISISHSKDLCAVTLCDSGEVGVDVQESVAPDRANRLESRYFQDATLPRACTEIDYMLYTADENGVMRLSDMDELLCVNEKYYDKDFSAKWALAEAAMKYDGRGFGAITEIEKILSNVSAEIVKLKVERVTYRIATVTKK